MTKKKHTQEEAAEYLYLEWIEGDIDSFILEILDASSGLGSDWTMAELKKLWHEGWERRRNGLNKDGSPGMVFITKKNSPDSPEMLIRFSPDLDENEWEWRYAHPDEIKSFCDNKGDEE